VFLHDAVYLEVPEADAEEAAEQLRVYMETALDLPATLYAEVHVGKRWIDL